MKKRQAAAATLLCGIVALGAGCGDARDTSEAHDRATGAVAKGTANALRDIVSTKLEVDAKDRIGIARVVFGPSASEGGSLDVTGLEVASVVHDGADVPFVLREEGRNVWLDLGIPAGASFDVEILYAFRVRDEFDGLLDNGSTFTWPYFCGNLFPCHPHPSDGATFELSVKNPPPGQTIVHPPAIVSDSPSYAVAWATGDYAPYESVGSTRSGIDIGFFAMNDGQSAAKGRASMARLPAMVDYFEAALGPYSFGKRIAGVQVNWGPGAYGGMEHHPYWHVAADAFDSAEVQVHEAAHGWFGDGIRLACWEDLVLSEGTASYLAAVALEEAGDPSGANIWASYGERLQRVAGKHVWPATCGQVDVLTELFNEGPYMKGAFFYRALEKKLSRAQVVGALGHVYAKFQGKAATMQDVLDQVREDTGFDPTACADEWLRATSLPTSTGAACRWDPAVLTAP